MKNCIIYSRVLKATQEEGGIAFDLQKSDCEIFAKENSLIIKDWVKVIGKDDVGFKQLSDVINKENQNSNEKIDTVLIHRLDRISRNFNKTIQFIEALESLNICVYSTGDKLNITEEFRKDNPFEFALEELFTLNN